MNTEYKNMAGRLIVALDYPDATQASALVEQLQGIPCYMKVGMQLFYAAGPDFVRDLKAKGYSVFLDLKMHDIPNTVKGGAESITRLGVDMFNVHAAGGTQMMQAAYEGMNNALASDTSLTKPIIIAVTQLTSTSQAVLNEQIGVQGSIEDAVVRYAKLTASAGLDGVVASAQEVPSIGKACGKDFITVTPGIRPAGSHIGDQSRVLTPGEAIQQGSHYIVVGRPITAASNPREAAEQIIKEMMNVE
ncbi:orotidine-5'-phosphate decarboxylase [Paenibacillus macquariensis]|uniref:Orotidine 5'-phosphate decarboxylase n=1 Tax=Paenibacillus macquariensis TaxID=948756 RepID=A0ABY1JLG1_9BACL|nr:orotidine-5'-phosphate decarboxylase [Paenibacillus macquariensis]MEC0090144.1 orotidine-5'-phosphate decarboxylase [Paenibacillus macquariensis]OAB30461.1 orotidine 5'-phosphate decarboxylase [Paenibacillus macquariensis subsp. macquariensis]SIQ38544.1 orotidine-5'-phosphate decarboxylase [Paenibacillus macquariensis]